MADKVQVAVRCRPLTPKEEKEGRRSVVKVDELRRQVHVQAADAPGRPGKERSFAFDTVFGPDAKQADVYNETARPIVDSVLEGYNGDSTDYKTKATAAPAL